MDDGLKQKQQQIEMPEAVRQILERLHAHGYEAYIVGGCVRDALLGRVPQDWDITTSALPEQVKEVFRSTVDTGIQHGTVMVLLGGSGYEVTTYRIDGEYRDSRHPSEVFFTRSLEEDLKRRDFTINAFAWGEEGLIDLFDGFSDLQQGVIRCVGNPDARFREDALRIMRAVRFSAQLGFRIDPATEEMAVRHAPRLPNISMERIRVEWEKTLLSDHPEMVNRYAELGMAPYIVPGFFEKCFDTEKTNLLRLFRRDGQMSEEQKKRLLLAAFFSNLEPMEAKEALRTLKYDNKTRDAVVKILQYRGTYLRTNKIDIKQNLNHMGLGTFLSVLHYQEAESELTEHCEQTGQEEQEEQPSGQELRRRLEQVRILLWEIEENQEPWQLSQLAVNGSDLIAAGVSPGKKIGEILENILQKVIQSPTLNTREQLLHSGFLRQWTDS